MAAALRRCSVEDELDMRVAASAYHDSQRQRACVAKLMGSGTVTLEDAGRYSVSGRTDDVAVPEVAKETVTQIGHRNREAGSGRAQMYLAAVARKVPRSEWEKPKARAALDAEW